MGSIRTRPDNGYLFMDFRYKGARFREQTAMPDNAANRKRLEKAMAAIEDGIAAGTFDYSSFFPSSKNVKKFDELNGAFVMRPVAANVARAVAAPPVNGDGPLFRVFAGTWFTEKEVEWRKSHRISTRADLDKVLLPRFGDKVVSQITKADILGFRAELSKVTARGKTTPLSARRINKIFGPLRQILDEAADRFDFRTPFHNIKQLKFRKTDIKPFSLDEVRQILDTVRPDFRHYYTVRFFTGMRTGEADGLKWKYVDFERRLILVRETVVGGDEFSILLVDADRESAVETAQRLVIRLAEPYDGIRSPVSASIGIAIYPMHGKDICQLLENADRALYVAKHGGRNAFRLAANRAPAPGS